LGDQERMPVGGNGSDEGVGVGAVLSTATGNSVAVVKERVKKMVRSICAIVFAH